MYNNSIRVVQTLSGILASWCQREKRLISKDSTVDDVMVVKDRMNRVDFVR